MYQIDFSRPEHLHFIGIGGISMSGLAEILLGEGFTISGSDMRDSPLLVRLRKLGASVVIGQRAENIVKGIDCVVYTAAVHEDNPELMEAVRAGIPTLTRAELLGEIMRNYASPITVAGTHGKTTTTSMCAQMLMKGSMDPTVTVGGILPAIHGNIRVGHSDVFIAEACEYTNSFLSFFPKIEIILNVDADHLDFFKDLDDIAESFRRFAALLPKDGTLIINRDFSTFDKVVSGADCEIITYSLDPAAGADYTASDIVYDERGCATFTCLKGGESVGSFSLRVPGEHNVSNALAAIALGIKLGIPTDRIARGLAGYAGTDRRFEHKGTFNGAEIIDDYAHHPTEIAATLKAAAKYPHRELYVAFQPHTYTRTSALLNEFADALKSADHLILADIYAARETNTIGVSSKDIADLVNGMGGEAIYLPTFEEIEEHLRSTLKAGDLLITMGAGNIVEVGENLAAEKDIH